MLEISGKHHDRPDEELLAAYRQSGDLDLLGTLYSRYMHLVYGISLKYLKNREDAEDTVIRIFEKLITELPRHKVLHFKSWLYVLSKNHCLMELRTRKRASGHLEAYNTEREFMESEAELHPIDRDDAGLEEALKKCIEALKDEQKQCIELFYYGKKCYQEIAEQLQMDEKKVKSCLQNGKRNLKICLEKKHVRSQET